jgi:uncharacterized membrane protein
MPDRLLTVIHEVQSFIEAKTEVVSGGLTGSIYGIYVVQTGYFSNLLLALFTSLLMGAAGALGGLIIKEIYNRYINRKKKAS